MRNIQLAYASLKTRRSFAIRSCHRELNKFLAFLLVLFNNCLKLNWHILLRSCCGGSCGISGYLYVCVKQIEYPHERPLGWLTMANISLFMIFMDSIYLPHRWDYTDLFL
jgi:hypothetical protein